jgi:hypothetical protein
MRRCRWILLGMGLWLVGCAPEYRVYELPAEPLGRETRVAHAAYFKSDAPHLREPDLSAFKVVSDTPGVTVEMVGCKPSKARRPRAQRRFSVLIAWDQSLSLEDTDPERRRFPAGERLVNDLPSDARLGLVNFASLGFSYADYDVRAPMGSTKAQIIDALQYLNRSDFSTHGTPLWNTLCNAIPELLANEPSDRERWVILFTDGQNQTAGHRMHGARGVAGGAAASGEVGFRTAGQRADHRDLRGGVPHAGVSGERDRGQRGRR